MTFKCASIKPFYPFFSPLSVPPPFCIKDNLDQVHIRCKCFTSKTNSVSTGTKPLIKKDRLFFVCFCARVCVCLLSSITSYKWQPLNRKYIPENQRMN